MREVWLHSNRRVFITGILGMGTLILALIGGTIFAGVRGWIAAAILLGGLAVVAVWALATLVAALVRPRVAYEAGVLLVFLEQYEPVRVPIDLVECFFLGQGPAFLPPLNGKETETQNVIVRLAEAAEEWKHRETDAKLAHWCESYITLRGTWCEPITKDRMAVLNRRLVEVQRERKARRQVSA